ncbi:hypothetical protein KKA33_03375 [Patescibacteria group bacterium]|nr:hypothetical protein [Patescibacteria group bacterium]
MKELFNKLSNLFSFGKEHRLINEGEEALKPVEKIQEVQGAEKESPKTSEEKVEKAEHEGSEKAEKALSWLTGAKEEAVKDVFSEGKIDKDADEAFKGAKADLPESPMESRGTTEKAKKTLEDAAMASMKNAKEKSKTREGLAELGKEFMGKAGEEKTAVAKTEEMGPFEPLDLSEEGEKEMAFTEKEVTQMMEEGEGEGQKTDEALMTAAHKAGVEAEAESPFEPMDLSDEGETTQVAGESTRNLKK